MLKRDLTIILTLYLILPGSLVGSAASESNFAGFETVSINGAATELSVSNGTFHLSNFAANESGVAFALHPFSDNGQITARIRRSDGPAAKVGLVFRETTNSMSRNAGMFLSGRNAVFDRVSNTNEPATTTVQTNANTEWLRVVREGSAVSGFYSNDGTNWTQISADTVEMSNEIFAGFAMSGNGEAIFEGVRMSSAHLSSPLVNSGFILPTNIFLKAEIVNYGTVASRVDFFSGANKIGEARKFPFTFAWTNALAGTHSVTAKITDVSGAAFFTEPVNCEAILPRSRAKFIRIDDVTRGNWRTNYGTEGFHIIKHATNYPAYAAVSSGGHKSILLNYSGEPDALKLTNGNHGIIAQWFTHTNMTVNLSLLDGRAHQVALYFHDSDSNLRVQQIEVIDVATRAVLDVRRVASFHTGTYFIWEVSGAVRFRITAISGNAVLGGLFFDASSHPNVESK